MDTYIDDIAGQPTDVNYFGTPNDLKMPGAFVRAGDVKVIRMYPIGQEAFRQGVPFLKMKEGVHFYYDGTMPFRPTPPDIFNQEQDKGNYRIKNRHKKQKIIKGKKK